MKNAAERLVAVAFVLAALSWSCVAGSGSKSPREPGRPLRLLVTGSTKGEMAECGCLAGPQGGLARRTALIEDRRREGELLLVDAGDFASTDTLDGSLVTGALAEYLARTRYDAVAIGERELHHPSLFDGSFRDRLLCANLFYANETKLVASPYRMLEVSGRRVGITALIDPELLGNTPAAHRVVATAPEPALREVVETMRSRGAEIVVLLAHANLVTSRSWGRLGLCDVVVVGHDESSRATPRVDNATAYVWTGDRGRFVGEAILRFGAEGPEELAGETVPLMEHLPRDETVQRWVERLKGERQRLARERLLARAAVRGAEPVAEASACAPCHESATKTWHESAHARASETLEIYGLEHADECVACHGTAEPGKRPAPGVQCTACHGAERHPPEPTVLRTDLGGCARCHDADNSPGFDPKVAWHRIEHGREPVRENR